MVDSAENQLQTEGLKRHRRWFASPELLHWKETVACGDYDGPFFSFPNDPLAEPEQVGQLHAENPNQTNQN